jgi:hypothetical protein
LQLPEDSGKVTFDRAVLAHPASQPVTSIADSTAFAIRQKE